MAVLHCLDAIDGKHINIQPPAHSGSTFRNYKGCFSVLLMAVVDAKYKFKYVSVGAQGRAFDAGVFAESDFRQALDKNLHHIPAAKLLPGSDMEVPFMFLGDDAYPLCFDLMKPYSFCQMDHEQGFFNYRLSHAEWWRMGLVYLQTGGEYSSPQLCSVLTRCKRSFRHAYVSTTTCERVGPKHTQLQAWSTQKAQTTGLWRVPGGMMAWE